MWHGGISPSDRASSSWHAGHPLWLQISLDVLGLGLMLVTVLQLGDPDVLLHVVWFILAIEAFAFGLRVASVRIGVASIFLLTYGIVADTGMLEPHLALRQLELTEWPLMIAIAVLVAFMADRVTNTGRHYAAMYRVAADRLLTAQEDERIRLARDPHDGVGQTLTAISVSFETAASMLHADDADRSVVARALLRAREHVTRAIDETRDVATLLRPPRLAEIGLAAAIRELAMRSGSEVAVTIDPTVDQPRLLAPETEIDAYRIVQESLANAQRHARAEHISIDVRRQGSRVVIKVADDGVGIPKGAADRGLGLMGMSERATAMSARLTVQPRSGGGTVVSLVIPLSWSRSDVRAPDQVHQVPTSVVTP